MTQNIAIWGYGERGHQVEELIDATSTDDFHIVAILDRAFERLQGTSAHPVLDPARVQELYRTSDIDGVIPAFNNESFLREVEGQLEGMGVPVLSLDAGRHRFEGSAFPAAAIDLSIDQRGYRLAALKDMLITPRCSTAPLLVCDDQGRIDLDYIYANQLLWDRFLQEARPTLDRPVCLHPGEFCLLAIGHSSNYWHFTFEALDKILLLEEAGFTGRYILLKTSFTPELVQLFGLDAERILWADDLDPKCNHRIETLVGVFGKQGFSTSSARVLTRVADRILANLPNRLPHHPKMLYVKRIGTRKANIPQNLLDRYGFEEMIPEEHPVSEQIELFSNADIVVSAHGANSTSSLYMRPGSVFVETFPNSYLNPCCLQTLDMRGVRYLMVPELYSLDTANELDTGKDYNVSPKLFEMTLRNAFDLLDKAPGA